MVVSVYVQLITALPPFWTLKREGCCSRFSPLLTPVQKETAGRPSGLHSPDFVFLPHVDLRKSGGTSLLLRLIINISKYLVSPKLSLTVQLQPQKQDKRANQCCHCSPWGLQPSASQDGSVVSSLPLSSTALQVLWQLLYSSQAKYH